MNEFAELPISFCSLAICRRENPGKLNSLETTVCSIEFDDESLYILFSRGNKRLGVFQFRSEIEIYFFFVTAKEIKPCKCVCFREICI